MQKRLSHLYRRLSTLHNHRALLQPHHCRDYPKFLPSHKDLQPLKEYLRSLKKVAVAFSGGVDSSFLLKTAHGELGGDCTAVTVSSCFVPESEIESTVSFCRSENIRHIVLDFNPLEIDGIPENPGNRCYLCKKALFTEIRRSALADGIPHVIEGSNSDDTGDYRPGLAALKELGVLSPLMELGFTKEEIRCASKELSLPVWNKSSAACLASRFVYGERITEEKLHRIEQAEQFLRSLGFGQLRVRIHGNLARIEVLPSEMEKLFSLRQAVHDKLKAFGFDYVTLDAGGFKSGSMNIGV